MFNFRGKAEIFSDHQALLESLNSHKEVWREINLVIDEVCKSILRKVKEIANNLKHLHNDKKSLVRCRDVINQKSTDSRGSSLINTSLVNLEEEIAANWGEVELIYWVYESLSNELFKELNRIEGELMTAYQKLLGLEEIVNVLPLMDVYTRPSGAGKELMINDVLFPLPSEGFDLNAILDAADIKVKKRISQIYGEEADRNSNNLDIVRIILQVPLFYDHLGEYANFSKRVQVTDYNLFENITTIREVQILNTEKQCGYSIGQMIEFEIGFTTKTYQIEGFTENGVVFRDNSSDTDYLIEMTWKSIENSHHHQVF